MRVGLPLRWATPIVLAGAGLAAVALCRFAADGFAPLGRFPLWAALLYACGVALVTARPTRTPSLARRQHRYVA